MVTGGGGVCQLGGGVPPSSGTVPEHWGSPRALCRGATSFRSGRKGLTALRPAPPPPRQGFTRAQLSRQGGAAPSAPPRAQPPRLPTHARTHTRTHARTHAASLFPLSPRARRHDRVGLHAGSDPRRASRHARRTRPRSAGSGAQSSRARGFFTPPEHVTASASAKYAVLCDFDTPPQGHKLSIYSVTRIQTCHTLAQTFTNPASPAANAGRVTLSHAVCGRDTGPSSYTGDIYTPIKSHQQHKDANR